MQTIDAQLVHQKKVRSFSDSNGFVNFFNITGQVAEIDHSNNRIRLLISRRNPNYFLDIEMESSRIPARYKALELVTIEGYVRGVQGENNAWGVRFVGRSINPASLVDLDEDALKDYFHRMNGVMGAGSAEQASADDIAGAQAESRAHVSEYRRKKSARRSGNYVGLSGFVDNAKLITGPVRDDGTKGPDSLKILLRQWDEKSKNILLELNGREAQRTLNGINVLRQQGVPFIRFHGEIYIKVKDVVVPPAEGEQSSEEAPKTTTLIMPVIKSIGHIDIGKEDECRRPREADDGKGGKTLVMPYPWTQEYLDQAQSVRAQRKAA